MVNEDNKYEKRDESAAGQLSQSQLDKQKYEKYAQKKDRREDYMRLYEFGFTDFIVNEYLLEKYNNLDQVAEMLMSGQVSVETINDIYQKAARENKL